MTLSALELNRATLARQMLLRREAVPVADAVRRLVALQAQEPASPYLALWNRIRDFDAADLDAAFADRSVVKASLIRLTLHAVQADDYPAFYSAMLSSLRASRLNDRRYTSSGLTTADADAVLPGLLDYAAEPRTKAAIEGFLAEALGGSNPRAWWALKMFAPLHHVPTRPPWSFGLPASFVAAPAATPKAVAKAADESVQRLVFRYLEGFGPASVEDFAQFTMLRRPVARAALEALGDRLERLEGADGRTLYDASRAARPSGDAPAPPRLLPMWDNVLLAYADRSRLIPPDYRRRVIYQNGDVLPTLLVDGFVAGVWRPVADGIEATAFHRLSAEAWRGLESEALAIIAFLAGRDPNVYRRYAHWWKTLESADVRVLGA